MLQGYSVTDRLGESALFAGHIEIDVEPKVFTVVLEPLAQPGSLLGRNELLDAV